MCHRVMLGSDTTMLLLFKAVCLTAKQKQKKRALVYLLAKQLFF